MARKTITLQDINEAADAQYGTLDIPVGDDLVQLVNPLRLTDEKLEELQYYVKKDEKKTDEEKAKDEADKRSSFDKAADLIRITAKDAALGDKLIEALHGDRAQMKYVIEQYFEQEEAGKASSSQD